LENVCRFCPGNSRARQINKKFLNQQLKSKIIKKRGGHRENPLLAFQFFITELFKKHFLNGLRAMSSLFPLGNL